MINKTNKYLIIESNKSDKNSIRNLFQIDSETINMIQGDKMFRIDRIWSKSERYSNNY